MTGRALRICSRESRSIIGRVMAALMLLTPAVAQAQRAGPAAVVAQPGATVRAWTPGWHYTGTLGFRGADTVVIRFSGDSATLPVSAIQRIDVQQGTRRSIGRILVGTGVGLAIGTVVGAFAGVGLECGMSCDNDGEWAGIAGGVLGGATGGLVGGIAGGMVGGRKRIPRWVPAELPSRVP